MAPRHPLLLFLRRLAGDPTPPQDDAELLRRFRAGDAPAFAILVDRHAPLVWSVCSRLSTQPADAEDAFQATFLVLARKAASLRRPDLLGPWLYGVALRVATRARNLSLRRHHLERPLADPPAPPETSDLLRRELRHLLHEEIDRLPERFRTPFILCNLQGLTNEQAAQRLGCPKGTILSRLSRAREHLRRALTRRGVESTGAVLTAPLADQARSAAPPALVTAAAQIATTSALGVASTPAMSLATTVLRGMLMNKLKWACFALIAVCLVGSGAGFATKPSPPDAADDKPVADAKTAPAKQEPPAPLQPPIEVKHKPANEPTPPAKPAELLARSVKFAGFQDPKTTLCEALNTLSEKYDIGFDVNEKAFKDENINGVLLDEIAAEGEITPQNANFDVILRKILARIPARSGVTFITHKDYIEITTGKYLAAEIKRDPQQATENNRTTPTYLRSLVNEDFHKTQLSDALEKISTRAEINIVLSVESSAASQVTAKIRNARPETAVRILADMADLDVVRIENFLYVTTPAKAARMREKLKAAEPSE